MYTKNDLCFDVEIAKSSVALGITPLSDNEYCVIGYPNNERTLINTVSDRYKLTPIAEHLEIIENAVKNCFGEHFTPKYKMINYSKFYVDYILTDKLGFNVDDLLPKICFQHSYNGKLKTSVEIGIHRVVCKNGLTTLERLDSSINYKNTTNNNFDLQQFICSAFERINKSKTLKTFEVMAETYVKDYADRVLEIAAAVKFPVRQIDLVNDRIAEEAKLLNVKPNNWLIYNGFNFQLNHNQDIQIHDEFKMAMDHNILKLISQSL